MNPLHGIFSTSSFDRLDNALFEQGPIVERLGAQELEQRKELFDVVLKQKAVNELGAQGVALEINPYLDRGTNSTLSRDRRKSAV